MSKFTSLASIKIIIMQQKKETVNNNTDVDSDMESTIKKVMHDTTFPNEKILPIPKLLVNNGIATATTPDFFITNYSYKELTKTLTKEQVAETIVNELFISYPTSFDLAEMVQLITQKSVEKLKEKAIELMNVAEENNKALQSLSSYSQCAI